MLLACSSAVRKECAVLFKTIWLLAFFSMTSPAVPRAQTRTTPSESVVLADFNARIKNYVALRNKADNGAPPLNETKDAAKIKAAQDALAQRLRAARTGAKRG